MRVVWITGVLLFMVYMDLHAQPVPFSSLEECLYWDSRKKDSLRVYFRKLTNDPDQASIPGYISYFSGRFERIDSLKRAYFEDAIQSAKASNDLYLEGIAAFRIGRIFSRMEQYDSANAYYRQARKLFDTKGVSSYVNPARRTCSLLTSQSFVSIQLNDYEKAINYSLEALKLSESNLYDDLKLISLLNLSAAYGEYSSQEVEAVSRLKDLSKNYMFEAAKLAEKIGDKRRANRTYGNIAIHYETEGIYDSAKIYLRKAIVIANEIGDEVGLANHYNSKTLIFLAEGNIDSASVYVNFAETSAKASGLQLMESDIMLTKGRILILSNQYKQAELIVSTSIELAKAVNAPRLIARGYKILSEIAEIRGNNQTSLEYYKNYIAYRDSVVTLENLNAIDELKTRYETEKKEQQIANLEQEKVISDLKIQQQNAFLFIGTALVVILVIAGVFFYRNRTLRLAQQRLVVEQQLLRSQMNPHFLFNALGAIHAYIFKGQKREAAEYLSTFSELTRDILDQSSKEWIELEREIETLKKYIEVQQLRFPGIESTILVEEKIDIENVLIPPMLLQPFVENAFEHGLKDQSTGHIDIQILQESDSQIRVAIKDDGKGLGQADSMHESRAISIARERLNLLYGKFGHELKVTNQQNSNGVLVSIVFPKKEAL